MEVRLFSSDFQSRCLAGLKAGVLGGLFMLLYFSADAVLRRHRWASPEIVFGTAVYGNEALWHGNAKVILAGIGLQLVLAGVAGILCSLIFSAYRVEGFTAILAGLAFAGLWYFLWYFVLFPRIAPLVPLYISRSAAMAAHLLLGLLLARAPAYFRQIHPQPPPAPFVPLAALNQPSGNA